jgi:hypothetical protein
MRFISTRVHGVLDYLMGMVLIGAPWLLGFADNGPATWVPVLLGVGVIVYSLFTDYELGAFKAISMRGHLWLDGLSGLFLAASPWLFGFNEYVSTPHLVLGIAEFLAAVFTRTIPDTALVVNNSSRHDLGRRATPGLSRDARGDIGSVRTSTDIDTGSTGKTGKGSNNDSGLTRRSETL